MNKRGSFRVMMLFAGVLFTLVSIWGFSESIDEIEKKLMNANEKEKPEILNTLAKKTVSNQPRKSLDYSLKALELARKYKDIKNETMALRNEGSAYQVLGETGKALDYFFKALELAKKENNKKEMGFLFHNIGITYYTQSNYKQALEYIKQSGEIADEIGFKPGRASCLNIAGIIYDEMGLYDKAIENYLESIRIYEESGDKAGQAILTTNVGVVYRKLGRFDKALEYYNTALKIETELNNKEGIARNLNNIGVVKEGQKDYRNAKVYYEKSLKLKRDIGNKKDIGATLDNLGNIYRILGQYDMALTYYNESLKIREEMGEKKGVAEILGNLGRLYFKQHRIDNAISAFEKSLSIAIEINAKDALHDIYKNLSGIYEEKKDYQKALSYFKLFVNIKDEILSKESNDKMAELQTKYETQKKEKEIALLAKNNELLQKNNEIQKLKLSRERLKSTILIAGIVLILVIGIVLFKQFMYLFSFWKRKNYIGHYRIIEEIGSGGMGIVYKATHIMDREKTAALKVIREEHSKDPTYRKRFLNEAAMIDQLDHPNIVKIYERGESNQRLFIAMEMLQGNSLAEIIKKGELIPIPYCLKIMTQLTEALDKIHSRGIIHRDLKPENIMILEKSDTPFVKLLDFGLARTQSLTRLTETGEILGTINYLPPERIAHQEYSPLGDLYSLGIVFYEMLTLEKPFLGETPVDIIKQILEKEPPEPAVYRKDIPVELNDFIIEMIRKEPTKRPSGKQLIELINGYC